MRCSPTRPERGGSAHQSRQQSSDSAGHRAGDEAKALPAHLCPRNLGDGVPDWVGVPHRQLRPGLNHVKGAGDGAGQPAR